MASLYPTYPPSLNQSETGLLLESIKDWSIANGLAVRPSSAMIAKDQDPQGVSAVPAPVTLFPSCFPKSCYEEALAVQKAYNELYARISSDEEWLVKVIKELVDVDEYTTKLFEIYQRVKAEGYAQDLDLGLFRSDYLVHVDPNQAGVAPELRQVEFNTISSSFGGLVTRVAALHRYLCETRKYPRSDVLQPAFLPYNDPTSGLADAIATASRHYGSSKADPALRRCVLFVVQSPERNIFDQRHLEYALESRGLTVFRLPFASTLQQTMISDLGTNPPVRPLIFTPPHAPSERYEVSVLYFRSTYTPDEFPSESAWEARYQLERSSAIKCPSIPTHLAGTKKVQQVLATPGARIVGQFLKDEAMAKRVENTFAAIFPMDESEAGNVAKAIATDPAKSSGYVLKPQREGGGNNVYRDAIPAFLRKLGDEDKWRGHILMELIEPPSQTNTIFRDGQLQSGEVIAELGIFGACLWRRSTASLTTISNSEAGYLLRTKGRSSQEGGVAAGFGSIDSICLVDF